MINHANLFLDDFDRDGTSDMIIRSLMKTLGLEKDELADVLENMVADGVHLERHHRCRGGGSLSVVSALEEKLGLAPNM